MSCLCLLLSTSQQGPQARFSQPLLCNLALKRSQSDTSTVLQTACRGAAHYLKLFFLSAFERRDIIITSAHSTAAKPDKAQLKLASWLQDKFNSFVVQLQLLLQSQQSVEVQVSLLYVHTCTNSSAKPSHISTASGCIVCYACALCVLAHCTWNSVKLSATSCHDAGLCSQCPARLSAWSADRDL